MRSIACGVSDSFESVPALSRIAGIADLREAEYADPFEICVQLGACSFHGVQIRQIRGVVALIGGRPICPFPSLFSAHGNDLGGAEGVVSVHDGDADLDLCGLPIGVARGDALTEGLEAIHPRLDPTSDVVAN